MLGGVLMLVYRDETSWSYSDMGEDMDGFGCLRGGLDGDIVKDLMN